MIKETARSTAEAPDVRQDPLKGLIGVVLAATDTKKSRWALDRDELLIYVVVMLVAMAAPFSGFIFVIDAGGVAIDVLSVLWLPVGLTLGMAYFVQRRRRTAVDDLSDQFFDR